MPSYSRRKTAEHASRSRTDSSGVSSFDPFARFYDLDTEGLDADLAFWIQLARRTGGPVLEIGCGTGRVLLPLARAGFSVVGVDVSPAMLAIAREKVAVARLGKQVELVQADALDLHLNRLFPLVFVALNSFGHFAEPGEPARALESMRAHLEPGGLVALDLTNPTPGAFGETNGLVIHEYTRPGPTPGWQTVKLRSQWQDYVAQRIDVSCMYDEVSPSGEIRRTLAPFVLRYFYPNELRLLFERAGLTVEAMYGSYDLDPLSDESDRLIVIGRS
jgi:SAM-dependent methyltransferase